MKIAIACTGCACSAAPAVSGLLELVDGAREDPPAPASYSA